MKMRKKQSKSHKTGQDKRGFEYSVQLSQTHTHKHTLAPTNLTHHIMKHLIIFNMEVWKIISSNKKTGKQ